MVEELLRLGNQAGILDQLEFGDGTIWNNATIRANVISLAGTANTQTGTAGDDTFNVDHRNDVGNEAAGAGIDTIVSTVSYTLSANVENLTLSGPLGLYGQGQLAQQRHCRQRRVEHLRIQRRPRYVLRRAG